MQFTLNNTCRLCLRNYTVVVVLHRAAISGSFSLRHPPAATRATTTPGRDTLFTNTSASTLQLIYCSSSTHHSSSHQLINSHSSRVHNPTFRVIAVKRHLSAEQRNYFKKKKLYVLLLSVADPDPPDHINISYQRYWKSWIRLQIC